MNEKTDKKREKKQKGNSTKVKGVPGRGINKIIVLLNVLVFCFLGYQAFSFYKTYSGKNEVMFSQGRVINIDPKNNEISLTDISDQELAMKRAAANPNAAGDIVGPMPKDAGIEQLVGPMPADAKKEDAKAPAAPAKPVDYKTANLAVIITEIGPQNDSFELAKTLPREVSFAFSPYTDNLQKKIDFAVGDGRMVLLNLMMQPSNFPMRDNGPMSIQVNYDENQNIGRFEKTVKLANRFSGVLATNDEVVTSKFDKLAPILKKVSERNIFFGYFRSTNNVNVDNDAKPLAADIFGVDYLIDSDPDPDEMAAQLAQVKEDLVVKKKKVVIAIRAFPNSINFIKKWLEENTGDNINIAPINYFVTSNRLAAPAASTEPAKK